MTIAQTTAVRPDRNSMDQILSTKERLQPTAPAISLKGINKAFGLVQANRNVNLSVAPGTIHGIVGENGAGKSTLMSILYGFYQADSGSIFINGRERRIVSSTDAINAGVGMVHQHFMLVRPFTSLENIVLGAEGGPFLGNALKQARTLLKQITAEYGLDVDPDAVVEDLPVGAQQRVEILKALYRKADLLILDEPTSVLTPSEADHLFRLLNGLRDSGKTVIFITHKLREIIELTDTVSVMRAGEMSEVIQTSRTSIPELAERMVGRIVQFEREKDPARIGKTVLSVRNASVKVDGVARLKNIDLEVRAGEVLGIAGVAGNGQTELLECLSGMRALDDGSIILSGQSLAATGSSLVRFLRASGVGHIPEDRHKHGLVAPFMAWENCALGHHRKSEFRRGPLMDITSMQADAGAKFEAFDVRPRDIFLKTANFSGGNQQKIVVAREIAENPDLLLVGQPTRGVDIGAIEFIHNQILELRAAGKAILLVSVELDEILALSDRISVMFDGRISGTRLASETNESDLGQLMGGVDNREGVHATTPKMG